MAAPVRNKQSLRHQNRNISNYSKTREYGEMLYGHKRKASFSPSSEDASPRRVTRSNGSKLVKKLPAELPRNSSGILPSKIPRLNKNIQKMNSPSPQTGNTLCHTGNVFSPHEPESSNSEILKSKVRPNHSESDINNSRMASPNPRARLSGDLVRSNNQNTRSCAGPDRSP